MGQRQHLKRAHTQPLRCPRCWKEMRSRRGRDEHLRNPVPCDILCEPDDDRISAEKWEEIDSARDLQSKSLEEKYIHLYRTLFGVDEKTPNPCESTRIMFHDRFSILRFRKTKSHISSVNWKNSCSTLWRESLRPSLTRLWPRSKRRCPLCWVTANPRWTVLLPVTILKKGRARQRGRPINTLRSITSPIMHPFPPFQYLLLQLLPYQLTLEARNPRMAALHKQIKATVITQCSNPWDYGQSSTLEVARRYYHARIHSLGMESLLGAHARTHSITPEHFIRGATAPSDFNKTIRIAGRHITENLTRRQRLNIRYQRQTGLMGTHAQQTLSGISLNRAK